MQKVIAAKQSKSPYSGVLLKREIFIKMIATCFAPSFLQKRGVLERGWLQVRSSHFNEKLSLRKETTVVILESQQLVFDQNLFQTGIIISNIFLLNWKTVKIF